LSSDPAFRDRGSVEPYIGRGSPAVDAEDEPDEDFVF
jgi:hypothetical protein